MIPIPKHYFYSYSHGGWRLDLRDKEDNRYFFIFHSDSFDSFESDLVDYIVVYEDEVIVYYRDKIDGDVFKKTIINRCWSVTSRETDILCE